MAYEFTDKDKELIKRMQTQDGLILMHGTGSGKTRKAISLQQGLNLPGEFIVPASLQKNIHKEYLKHLGSMPDNVEVKSQQGLARDASKLSTNPNRLMVIDESHLSRNPVTNLHQNLKVNNAAKRLMLSGTALYNHPKDIASQINLVANQQVLPESKEEFERQYTKNVTVDQGLVGKLLGVTPGQVKELKNQRELKSILNKYVDYHETPKDENFPSTTREIVKVPMAKEQMDLYNTVLNKADFITRYKIKRGLPPNKRELEKMKAFLGGLRQLSNTNTAYTTDPNKVRSPKIQAAVDFLRQKIQENPRYKGVVYSNYLDSGIRPYAQMLDKYKIPYGEFTGAMSDRERQDNLKKYNQGLLKALLISGAGTAGLDTKKTRLIQLLEPHFNAALEEQVEGRGVRYKSHEGLSPDERNVLIQRYLSTPQESKFSKWFGTKPSQGVDEYIYNLAQQKKKLNDQVYELMRNKNF